MSSAFLRGTPRRPAPPLRAAALRAAALRATALRAAAIGACVAAATLIGAPSAHAQPRSAGGRTAGASTLDGVTDLELFDYTVERGDTCAAISLRFFGNRRRYDLIHAHNPRMGPPPHTLVPGTVLRLPRRASDRGADATVTGVEWRVEARPRPADEAWVTAERGLGLYRGGRVATHARSAAELTFRDTSVVTLRERTLVIIFGSSVATTRTAGMEATLETGALRTHLGALRGAAGRGSIGDSSEGASGNELRVVTSSATTTLRGGSAVVGVDEAGTSRVSNHAGRARVEGRVGGRAVPLPPDTGSLVRRGERPTPPRPLPAAPAWLQGPRTFAGVAGTGGSVEAAWTPVANARGYRVELSRDPGGTDVAFAVEVPASVTRFEAHRLPAGVYHATIATFDADLLESRPSSAVALTLLDGRLFAPGDDRAGDAPAFSPGDPSVEPSAEIPALQGSLYVPPEGVRCGAAPEVELEETITLSCVNAAGEPVLAPRFAVRATTAQEPDAVAPEPPLAGERVPDEVAPPEPARDEARSPRLTGAYARSPVVSALALTDLDRRGSTIGLSLAEIAPVAETYGRTERTRIAVAADVSLADDALQLGTLVPFDVQGRASGAWEAGSLDVYAHARWVALRRDPSVSESLALAIDLGAWFPTHPEGLTPDDRSGLPLVRLAPSIELAYAIARTSSFRMRQGALLDLDETGARLWASAYGFDVGIWGPLSIGVELDLALGTEIGASLFALGAAPQLAIDFDPLVIDLGMRFGLNRDGQALFGAASVALSASVALD